MDEKLPPDGALPVSIPPTNPSAEASPASEVSDSALPAAAASVAPQPEVATASEPSSAPVPPPISVPPPLLPPPPVAFQPPPPPPRTPPPIMMPQPTAPRGGRVWKILTVLLFLGLGLSLLANFKQLFTGSVTSSYGKSSYHKRHFMEEITLEDNGSKNKIAVIDIEGVIAGRDENRASGSMVEDVRNQLKAAAKDSHVKAVILKVNSPGGEVLASDDIYHAIDDFQSASGKPVVASMQTLAASGGYYVSAPCRWIVANEMTITGSIGVIMHGMNFSGLLDKVGVRSETYKSGKFKDMLSPTRHPDEIPPEERAMVQGLIMETYGKFTNIVETGRNEAFQVNKDKGRMLDEGWASYADGRVMSGRQAFDLGFVDELGDFQTAMARAESLAKIVNADLIQYQQPFDLGNLFRLFGQASDRSVKVDLGVKVSSLQPGCLYFIYRQAVP